MQVYNGNDTRSSLYKSTPLPHAPFSVYVLIMLFLLSMVVWLKRCILNKVSRWRDVTLLARRVLPLVSYVAPWNVTDADRRRQTHGEQNDTGPYTVCRRASNKSGNSVLFMWWKMCRNWRYLPQRIKQQDITTVFVTS